MTFNRSYRRSADNLRNLRPAVSDRDVSPRVVHPSATEVFMGVNPSKLKAEQLAEIGNLSSVSL